MSIKDAHDRQYNYMKITIFTLIGVHETIKGNVDENQGAVVVVIVWWMDGFTTTCAISAYRH